MEKGGPFHMERNVCLRTLVPVLAGAGLMVVGFLLVRASWWVIAATIALIALWWAL